MTSEFEEFLQEGVPSSRVKISFQEFLLAFRAGAGRLLRLLAIILPLTFVAVVVWLRVSSTTSYTAAMTIAPNHLVSNGGGGMGGSLSSLIGLQSPTDAQFELYLSTRKSNLLAERMMAVPGLPQRIFMGLWDEENHRWAPPSGAIASFRRSLSDALGFSAWSAPTSGDLAAYLSNFVTVTTDRRTLITHIEFSNGDKQFAKSLLTLIHETTEDILRTQAKQRTRIMIDYVVNELRTVTVTEQRQALIELLSEQEKQMMMIGNKLPYAAVVVDPPSADLPGKSPRPLLTVFLSLLLAAGAIIAGFSAWTLFRLRRAKALDQSTLLVSR